jgi:H+-transporting ATPase
MPSDNRSARRSDLENLPPAELFTRLGTTSAGLSSAEAAERLATYGPNELTEKKVNPFLKFLSYFWGPIAWMIEAAAILSALVHHWEDLIIIVVLLVGNAMVGFWEEYQAGNAIAALKAQLALQARVRRDGAWKLIAARDLVPGDVVRLRLGDIIPADAKLIDGGPVEIDQSALTGESLPVERTKGASVYSGSVLKQGEAGAVVYGTGSDTFFGRTASLVQEAHTVSHFQRAVLKIGNFLIVTAIVLVIVILTAALVRGDNMSMTLEFALVLTVAAIPVAMPAVLSVTMAVGARALAAKQAIVARLASIEELAGMDVLCSDKTGTLTENKLTLGDPFALGSNREAEVIQSAALASRAENADAIDLAVLSGVPSDAPLKSFDVLDFRPFDPVRKRTEATVRGRDGKVFRVAKGAPQVILGMAEEKATITGSVNDAVNGFAERGFRSLGVARAEGDSPWHMLGVLPLFDPPRSDSRETIATARRMGIAVKMVTGDQAAIAKEIAGQLDLGTNILEAGILDEARHAEGWQIAQEIERADGFAQVFPEHKFHIVEELQKRNHIVGMTGDGVNDAPALKKADAGIAVTGATDAARAAAAIVLLSPGLSVIIDAIKESRKIFQRMNSYAIYRIAETIRVLVFMTLSILVFNFYPVTAAMIVLLALLNDGPILAIAYDNVRYSEKPEAWNMGLVLGISSVLGIAGVVASFGLFYMAEALFHLSRDVVQTFMFLKLAVAGHLTIFVTRTRGPFWSIKPAPILLWSAVATKLLATTAAVYGFLMTPIAWKWALLVWGYALAWFVVNDRLKLAAYKFFDARRQRVLAPAQRHQ